MEKGLKNNRHWLIKIGVAIGLFFLGVILTGFYILNSDLSFTVISKQHDFGIFSSPEIRELLAKDKIKGTFIADDNYLGMVTIRFQTFNRLNQDFLIFRIRRVGENKWYYENKYDTLQFFHNKHYPFGFPVIADSQGKKYEFEIESTKGEKGNAVALSLNEPVFISKYQYPKTELANNKKLLFDFLVKKVISTITNDNFVFVSLVYFLPFFIFFLYQNLTNIYYYLPIVFIFICLDIILVKNIYDSVVFILVLFLIILLKKLRFGYREIFIGALVFMLFGFVATVFNQDCFAEKASVYAFLTLVAGMIDAQIATKKY